MNIPRSCIKVLVPVAIAAAALAAGAAAHAQVSWSIGIDTPTYYEPAPRYLAPPPPPVYYQPAPPVYYEPPPPVYRQAPPAYYQPAPSYYGRPQVNERPGEWQHGRGYEQPRLSDMQQRALDNCSMLAWRDQGRCRATVMSTVR
ncbi:hypothetical protein ACSFA8_25020 [Variovorax sp. RT4R15]|uniref:hypothetical protein n=1 Tax=Variovorax sp. RT4R15 TaxID=3443737 RepID=UPI003F471D70